MNYQTRDKLVIGIICIIILWFILPRPPKRERPVVAPKAVKARIAIVLDDWGYNFSLIDQLRQIKEPLTLSILPNLPYSKQVAGQAKRLGFEVILHLPMEPFESVALEKDTILASRKDKIPEILDKDLLSLPGCRGVSNHMGSKATQDSGVMKVVFQELKKRGLYFLDSYVNPKSVCPALAKQMQIKFAKRDVFLDNQNDPLYIKGQVKELMQKAKVSGSAIGIGHARKNTLEVLAQVMPELERQGFKFVYLSELVH